MKQSDEHQDELDRILLARLDEKLDNIVISLGEIKANDVRREREFKEEIAELSKRITVLEAYKAKAVGAIAILTAIATYLWSKAFGIHE